MFSVLVTLSERFSLDDFVRAETHFLDAVLLPVHERNWRQVLSALNAADENGWALRFLLWAKGKRVKNVPLHRFAQHPKLLGWVVEQLDDLALLAMLRATTETGLTVAWQQPSPFTHGVLSVHPQRDGKWWAWLTVNEPEQIFPTAINALMDGAETLCFARLPDEEPADERERLKALASLGVQMRLWQPLLADRRESWEVIVEEARCRCWQLATGEWIALAVPTGTATTFAVPLPFRALPSWRAYGLRFPALVRFPDAGERRDDAGEGEWSDDGGTNLGDGRSGTIGANASAGGRVVARSDAICRPVGVDPQGAHRRSAVGGQRPNLADVAGSKTPPIQQGLPFGAATPPCPSIPCLILMPSLTPFLAANLLG
jgi:hypothetical protein